MKIDKNYVEFIQSIKRQIVQSRYAAARLANREQLLPIRALFATSASSCWYNKKLLRRESLFKTWRSTLIVSSMLSKKTKFMSQQLGY